MEKTGVMERMLLTLLFNRWLRLAENGSTVELIEDIRAAVKALDEDSQG